MPTIISEKHYRRLCGLLEGQKIILGGGHDDARRFIEPTLLADVSPDSPIMQEEIFGPILPMLPYESLDEVISFVRARPRPLAFLHLHGQQGDGTAVAGQLFFRRRLH